MVQLLNAQERSESEWREIVSTADSRLELTRIIVRTLIRLTHNLTYDYPEGIFCSKYNISTHASTSETSILGNTDFVIVQTPRNSTDSIIEISLMQH